MISADCNGKKNLVHWGKYTRGGCAVPIHVTSEIGPLRRVLLQRPGRELEHLSPETMEQLLFDDIPFLHRAQQEHDRFAELLR